MTNQPLQTPLHAPLELAPESRGIRALKDGDAADGFYAVRSASIQQTRGGTDYLKLILADGTGSVPAILWELEDGNVEAAGQGAVVKIAGAFSVHERYGPQVKIMRLRAAQEGEYDPAALVQEPPVPVDRMESDLRSLLATIQNADLRELLGRFFAEGSAFWARFRIAPAAKYYHQAYQHGLLEHSLSVAQAVSAAAAFFPGIDRDVAVTGALLHDVGKIQAYNDDPLAIDLTDAGRLEGEIPLGYYLVRREIEAIEGFDPRTAQAVLHIVLSHHGTLEHGSPVMPATREATLVHSLDNLGGKLGSFDRIERELPDGAAWSKFDRAIDAAAYFGARAA